MTTNKNDKVFSMEFPLILLVRAIKLWYMKKKKLWYMVRCQHADFPSTRQPVLCLDNVNEKILLTADLQGVYTCLCHTIPI